METLKKLLAMSPALGHANHDLPFSLFVHKNKGTALGVLTQQRGGYYQPIGCDSQQLESVAGGLPLASGLSQQQLCYVKPQKSHESPFHYLCSSLCGSLINSHHTQHYSASRLSSHETVLISPNITLHRCSQPPCYWRNRCQ